MSLSPVLDPHCPPQMSHNYQFDDYHFFLFSPLIRCTYLECTDCVLSITPILQSTLSKDVEMQDKGVKQKTEVQRCL